MTLPTVEQVFVKLNGEGPDTIEAFIRRLNEQKQTDAWVHKQRDPESIWFASDKMTTPNARALSHYLIAKGINGTTYEEIMHFAVGENLDHYRQRTQTVEDKLAKLAEKEARRRAWQQANL